MTKKKKNKDIDAYKKAILQHYTESYKSETYSRQRIDVITIALSTGGIVLGLTVLQFVYEQNVSAQTLALKTSIILFALTLIINYVNQHIAVKAHKREKQWAKKEEIIIENNLNEENEYEALKNYNKIMVILNTSVLVLLVTSVLTMSFFFITTF